MKTFAAMAIIFSFQKGFAIDFLEPLAQAESVYHKAIEKITHYGIPIQEGGFFQVDPIVIASESIISLFGMPQMAVGKFASSQDIYINKLHDGIDILVSDKTEVRSDVDGIAFSIESADGDHYQSAVAVLDQQSQFAFVYLHVRPLPLDGIETGIAVKRGDKIGIVQPPSFAMTPDANKRMTHLHVSILDIKNKRQINPNLFYKFDDSISPEVIDE